MTTGTAGDLFVTGADGLKEIAITPPTMWVIPVTATAALGDDNGVAADPVAA